MNQILIKQVEELQPLAPQPVPLEVHFPDMEGDAMTSSREYISSSSLPASPPITNGPETQHNFQNADTTSLPSPAKFFIESIAICFSLHIEHIPVLKHQSLLKTT